MNEMNLVSKRVYVSEDEWIRLEDEVKLELIALSRMNTEEIGNNLFKEERKLYEKLMEDE